MAQYDRHSDFSDTTPVYRYDGIRVTNGPEDLASTIRKFAPDSTLGQLSESLKISRVLAAAIRKKGLKIDFASQVFVQATTFNTRSTSLANRLKQIQPTLAKALFDEGIHAPILSIRAGKIAISGESEEDAYPTDKPRIAQAGASEAVNKEAKRVIDTELRQALERLAKSIER